MFDRINDGTSDIWLDVSSNGNLNNISDFLNTNGDTMSGNLLMAPDALVVNGSYTRTTLPAASTAIVGAVAYATDLVGNGGTTGLVFCDGVNWRKARNNVIQI